MATIVTVAECSILVDVKVGMVNLKYRLRLAPWATGVSKGKRVSADEKSGQVAASFENSHKTWSAPLTVLRVQVLAPSEKLVDLTRRLAGPVVT